MEHDARSVANKIIELAHENGEDVTPMKVNKLVYFCHAWMLGLYHEPLLSEPIEAWKYGPVVSSVYDSLRRYGGYPVTRPITAAPQEEYNENEEDLINQVWNKYGKFHAYQLLSMTHRQGTPWHQIWFRLGAFAPIPDPLIEQYYMQIKQNSEADG